MERMTVTEALAEIELIEKKVEKKAAVIMANLSRYEHQNDPYVKEDDGASGMLKREYQSMQDHWGRLIKFREAIAKANVDNSITVEGITKSISQWLAWKRDVQDDHITHLANIVKTVEAAIKEDDRSPKVMRNAETNATHLAKLVWNVQLPDVRKQQEHLLTIKEKLDGQLSLKNATIVVSID